MKNEKYKILYVDDEEINLKIFENNFSRDFTVYKADLAKKGLDILKNEEIAVIISDQRMPEMTGLEFFKETKKKWPKAWSCPD